MTSSVVFLNFQRARPLAVSRVIQGIGETALRTKKVNMRKRGSFRRAIKVEPRIVFASLNFSKENV